MRRGCYEINSERSGHDFAPGGVYVFNWRCEPMIHHVKCMINGDLVFVADLAHC